MPPHNDGHNHDHEHAEADDTNASLGTSLRPQVNFDAVRCLNESRPNAGREILKLYEDRRSRNPSLLSQEDPDEDPELLLVVPFTEAVGIKSLSVLSFAGLDAADAATSSPRTCRVFVNRPDIDFETARDLAPQCTLDLAHPSHQVEEERAEGCTLDYYLRPAGRFQNVSEIALYFCDNFAMPEGTGAASNLEDTDEDRVQTEISYVGFKGQGTNVKRKAVKAVYETRGMRKDHKTPGNEYLGREGV